MNRHVKQLRRVAEEARPYMASPLWEALDQAIRKLEPRTRIPTPRPKAPGATKAERRQERNDRAAEIRDVVMKRAEAQGGCEWCPAERKTLNVRLEWHHLAGGGARRHEESIENSAGICWDCHRGWERSDMHVMRAAKEWSIRGGFRDALRIVDRRIEKALRVQGVPVRVEEEAAR